MAGKEFIPFSIFKHPLNPAHQHLPDAPVPVAGMHHAFPDTACRAFQMHPNRTGNPALVNHVRHGPAGKFFLIPSRLSARGWME